jgi:hypothetical protein
MMLANRKGHPSRQGQGHEYLEIFRARRCRDPRIHRADLSA